MDAIANMIIQLKNAGDARKSSVVVPYSKMKMTIAEILKDAGYLAEVKTKGKEVIKGIELVLAETDGVSRIQGVKRVSKQSRRLYIKAKDIRPVKYGRGLALISTPKGIRTGESARKEKVGGEVLFEIW